MKDSTIIALGRTACGTALLIVHALTGMNSLLTTVSLFLLGVPIEIAVAKIQAPKEEAQ